MRRNDHEWAIVLAAGEGSRLRSLTKQAGGSGVPKQFCSLDGGPSLLERTLDRARRVVAPERVVVVVARQHWAWWRDGLPGVGPSNVVVQPANRGTAAGILLPLSAILARDPAAAVVVLPSDHEVRREEHLADSMGRALDLVRADPESLVLLGMAPKGDGPDLGWIVAGTELPSGAHEVVRFVEKPGAERGRELRSRGAYWNSFLFAAGGATLRRLFATHRPALARTLTAVPFAASESTVRRRLEAAYGTLEPADFSKDVLERAERLRVLPVPDVGWCDLGTPERVADALAARGASPVARRGRALNLGAVLAGRAVREQQAAGAPAA